MAERLVAADASPLIGLASAGAFELLRMLFRQVTVTGAVRDEVLAGGDLPGSRGDFQSDRGRMDQSGNR